MSERRIKRRGSPPPLPTPHVLAAVICERVLIELDKSISAIRIIDKVTVNLTSHGVVPDANRKIDQINVDVSLLLILRAGQVRGKHPIRLFAVDPNGQRHIGATFDAEFREEHVGVNYVWRVDMQLQQAVNAVHWFEVVFDERFILTRVPLLIEFE